jgi:PKD repeat protein
MDLDGSHAIPIPDVYGRAWSPDGTTLLWGSGDILVTSFMGGTSTNLTNHPAHYWEPKWSPDGTRIAFASDRDGPRDLYVMNADGSGVVRIVTGAGTALQHLVWPAWSPDGARIAFASDRDGPLDLYVTHADGSGAVRVGTGVGMAWQPTWSPNNGRLAFACIVGPVPSPWTTGNHDVCAINADGSGFARLTSDPGTETSPDWSPDGARILFLTDRYGGFELAVMNPDGSGVTRVGPGITADAPTWSSDGTRIAFLSVLPYNPDEPWMPWSFVFVVNADGTDLTDLGWGLDPTWRPFPGGLDERPSALFTFECSGRTCTFDGAPSSDLDGTIASYWWQFGDGATAAGATVTHTFAGGHEVRLIVMDDKRALGISIRNVNQPPVVSFTTNCIGLTCAFDRSASSDPDGELAYAWWRFGDRTDTSGAAKITHTFAAAGTYIVTLTVGDQDYGESTQTQAVTVVNVNAPPAASFTSACSGLTCSFNAAGSSDSDGTIVSYAWTFGDATTGSGATASRTYTAGGSYTVTLTVTDNAGLTNQTARGVAVNAPPVASFTSNCSGLTCSVNAAGSSDPDGTIASYAWTFGDGTTGSGVTAARTYAAGGSYTVTLIVTDNAAATGTQAHSVTAVAPLNMHVGDLDRARTIQPTRWTAIVTITVHDAGHGLVANATVSGSWNNDSTASCSTNASGQCAVSRSGILKTKASVSFTVTNVARATFVYKPAENHDPDGDSNGTTVTVTRQ